jgi:hypothetical protein
MSGTIGLGSKDGTVIESKLFKDTKTSPVCMEPAPDNTTSSSSSIERFIKENSGEYDKKALFAVFSGKLNLKDYKRAIANLRESGKIAIDREGKIVWIWYPELKKEYLNSKNLIF